jgi:hypothetical protein
MYQIAKRYKRQFQFFDFFKLLYFEQIQQRFGTSSFKTAFFKNLGTAVAKFPKMY